MDAKDLSTSLVEPTKNEVINLSWCSMLLEHRRKLPQSTFQKVENSYQVYKLEGRATLQPHLVKMLPETSNINLRGSLTLDKHTIDNENNLSRSLLNHKENIDSFPTS